MDDSFPIAILQNHSYNIFSINYSLTLGNLKPNITKSLPLLNSSVLADSRECLVDHNVLVSYFYTRHNFIYRIVFVQPYPNLRNLVDSYHLFRDDKGYFGMVDELGIAIEGSLQNT